MKDTEIKIPDGWEYKDKFKEVFLNKYGYYELREKAPRDERKKYFEDSYFQEYAGATYEKVEYPPQERTTHFWILDVARDFYCSISMIKAKK